MEKKSNNKTKTTVRFCFLLILLCYSYYFIRYIKGGNEFSLNAFFISTLFLITAFLYIFIETIYLVFRGNWNLIMLNLSFAIPITMIFLKDIYHF